MKRLEFLKTLGALGMTTLLPGAGISGTQETRGKVIIVGAGMSGVAAARYLQNRNWEVTVLEARNRIGGRVWTDHSLGKPVDMGASWIQESNGNPLTKLAKKYLINTVETNWESVALYDYKGKYYSKNEVSKILDEGDWVTKKAYRIAGRQDKDRSVGWGVEKVLKGAGYSEKELHQIHWRLSTHELDAAIEFDKLSAWGDREDGYWGGDLIFPNGYGELVESLADNLPIYTSQIVKEVSSTNEGIKVITDKETHEGDFVIITVPLGVLKKKNILFDPPLPESKLTAIEQLGMGNLNKLALKFKEIMWPTKPHFLGYMSETKGEFPVFVNWAHYINQPFLLGTIGNQMALQLDQMDKESIASKINTALSKAWKKEVAIDKFRYSGWAKDEFAGGSYSYLPVGVKGKMYDALAKPVGKILFAGEATNRGMSATVHGAYLSGIREAKSIVDK